MIARLTQVLGGGGYGRRCTQAQATIGPALQDVDTVGLRVMNGRPRQQGWTRDHNQLDSSIFRDGHRGDHAHVPLRFFF